MNAAASDQDRPSLDFGTSGVSVPTVHVISDSLGDTAADVALAAASQFSSGAVHIERLPKAHNMDQVKLFLDIQTQKKKGERNQALTVFYTIADPIFREELAWELERRDIISVDLLGPSVSALSQLTGEAPSGKSGAIRKTDARYFRRIEAMEFSVNHDDGRNTHELTEADIVLIGVSRTSKTPLSMYMAFQGYRVANVPLAPGMEPPAELFEVDTHRLYGLISTPQVLSEIRHRRLGSEQALLAAGSYAEPMIIEDELKEARALMRRLGCIVIRTDNKAVEETAQEILLYFEAAEMARAKQANQANSQ